MRILMLGNSFTFTNHMPQMLADLTGAEVVLTSRERSHLALARDFLEARGLKRVGFESASVSVAQHRRWQESFPKGCELIPAQELLDGLRASKDREEIAAMVQAQKITDAAFGEILNYIRPGLTEQEVAARLVYELLRRYKPRGVLHCYSGSAEDAAWLTAQGLYIGFGGVTTFKNARKAVEVAQWAPLHRLLVETDCPYMAPEPYRGRRSDSTMIPKMVEKIAELRGLPVETVAQATRENAMDLFSIPRR